jgi:hypothetical protein
MSKTKERQLKVGDFVRCNKIIKLGDNGSGHAAFANVISVHPNLLNDGEDIIVIQLTERASRLTYDGSPEEQRSKA